MSTKIFCLMGPTASGKTALACELVQRFPFEIISVDSAMIYRGMDIGTAKPGREELEIAPHHLIDIIDPPASFSAAEFCEETTRLCALILSRGKIPLLVGGTMMYFNALQQGLSRLPAADESIRARLVEEAEQRGWRALHAELALVDPVSASRIHAHDTQRIQRALEIFQLTGKPLSLFLAEEKPATPFHYINLLLLPTERSWLHERIAQRFKIMLEQGFVEEVEALLQKWQLSPQCPAMRSVGYRQALEYLAGNVDFATFCEKGIAATRQLAKRQLTWLRSWPDAHSFASESSQSHREIMAIIDKIIDNTPQNP
ncbi:MAG: tRNA (adenosine(37)-N6)-dimethylallyltransferase MiaA [Legionella sp.]|nr:tRNA (adenosine(37)-N6)-dimethylallyltransferase MiaA [Legionella sp.]